MFTLRSVAEFLGGAGPWRTEVARHAREVDEGQHSSLDSDQLDQDLATLDVDLSPWAESVAVEVNKRGATVSVRGHKLLGPWFANAMNEWDPSWKTRNPISQLCSLENRTDDTVRFLVAKSEKLVRNITLRAGENIRARLCAALRSGALKATGLSVNDGVGKRKPVTRGQLGLMEGLDVLNNQITFRVGIPPIVQLELSPGLKAPGWKPADRSFNEADDLIIEMMRGYIGETRASVGKAARHFAPQAMRKPGGTLESVVDRIRRAYGTKYPSRPGI